MTPALFSKGEYIPLLKSWWKLHTGHEFKHGLTAQHGIVIKDAEGRPICLCFLYFPSNSRLCQLAFVTRDPSISPIKAGKAVKLLIGFSVHACKKLGYDMIYTATANKTIGSALNDSGYVDSPDGPTTVEFTKEL